MDTSLSHPGNQKVDEALKAAGISAQIVVLPQSTRTAPEAAVAVKCNTGQIVKSLIFRGSSSGQPYLFLVSGNNRLDETLAAGLLNEAIERADPAFVRQHTGFAIGGVAPAGFPAPLTTYIDLDLQQYTQLWAAAGTPNTVFAITPSDLVKLTRGQVVRVC